MTGKNILSKRQGKIIHTVLLHLYWQRASLVTQMVKNLPAMWETWFWSLGQENPLEKGMAHPVFLPREFHGHRSLVSLSPWGSQRVRHDWVTKTHTHTHTSHASKTNMWWQTEQWIWECLIEKEPAWLSGGIEIFFIFVWVVTAWRQIQKHQTHVYFKNIELKICAFDPDVVTQTKKNDIYGTTGNVKKGRFWWHCDYSFSKKVK